MPSTPLPISILRTLGFMRGFAISPWSVPMLVILAISLAVLLPVSAGGQTVTSIAVTPSDSTVTVGQAQQFTATATYSNGSTSVLTSGPGTWATKASLRFGNTLHAVAGLNGILYSAGGTNYSCGAYNNLEAYDPSTNVWSARTSMPTPRWAAKAVAANGKLYVLGGNDSCGGPSATPFTRNEAYDPTTNTWTTMAPIPTGRSGHAGVAVVNGIIYVVGGDPSPGFPGPLNTVEAYDPVSNTWSTKAAMPTPRTALGVAVVNGILYAVGGSNNSGNLNILEAYDPATNTWTTKAPMPSARVILAAAELGNLVYAVGGYSGGYLNTVEAYDPSTNSWSTKPSMPTPHGSPGVGTVNGVLYVTGGQVNPSTPTSTAVEAYTPAGANWSSSDPGVATISNSGLATGLAPGSTTISATSGSVSGSTTLTVVAANQPPVANAGPNQTVGATSPSGAAVTLNGSASSDPNGDPLTYTWTGSFGTVSGVNPTVTLAVGTHTISLTVYDGYVSATSSVMITVTPAVLTSIAVTPADPTIFTGQTQSFTATGTFSDGSSSVLTSGGGTWASKAVLPNPRWGSAFGAINGKIVVAGGYNGSHLNIVQTYDTVSNTWTNNNGKPATQTSAANGVIGGLLYSAGGTNCCVEINDLWVYNPSTDSWTSRAPLPSVRQASGGGVLNGKLHVVGGHAFSVALNLHHAYDPVTNTWTAKAPMPTPRTLLGVGVVNGILYAVGGLGTGFASVVSTVEAYDPVTDTWTTKASMPTARSQIRVEVVNGILYAIGGTNPSGVLSTVEAYDPVSNTWTTETPMITARSYLTSGVVNGVIYAIAGVVSTTPGSNANEAFTPAANPVTWSSSDLGVATISGSALAAGVSPGTTTIRATSGATSGSTTLTVVDPNQPPVANAGIAQTAEALSASGAAVTLDGSASSDPDSDSLTYTWSGPFGTASGASPVVTLPLGTSLITLTVDDGQGHSSTSTTQVTVVDTTPPVISGTPANIVLEATNPLGEAVSFALPTTSDLVDGSVAVSCTPASGSTFTLGTQPVNCTATDAAGNSAHSSFTVTVRDTTSPVISGTPANIVLEATNPLGEVVSFAMPTASDLVDGSVAVSCTPASGSTFTLGTQLVSCTATDARANSASTSFSVTVRDTTPPTVSCGVADGAWHGSDVSIACTASDLVGLAAAGNASFSLSTNVAAGVETSNAGTASRSICDASGNCVTAGPIGGNRVDKKGPGITISAPASGGSYVLNQLVASNYGCTDGGSGMGSCAGTVANGSNFNTATVGTQSLTVTATDAVGNTTTLNRTYDVVYSLGACLGSPSHQILQPINGNGTSVFKKGSVVPTKFRVCDANGNVVSTAGVVTGFVQVASVEGTVTEVDEQLYSNTPDTGFRWDASAQQWIFNLDTKNNPTLAAGSTYVFRIYLLDGTFIQYQFGLK